jgi:peptide deformylase
MSVLPILRMGNPLLNEVSKPVTAFDTAELHKLVEDMLATMKAVNGAGLAAVQVGVLLRVMIFGITKNPRYPDAEPVPTTVLINPEIEVVDSSPKEYFEGCLSVPGLRGPVLRPDGIRYRGYDQWGRRIDKTVRGFHARVVQHEFDHLEGRLFPSRVTDFTRFGFTEDLEAGGVIPKITPPATAEAADKPASKL